MKGETMWYKIKKEMTETGRNWNGAAQIMEKYCKRKSKMEQQNKWYTKMIKSWKILNIVKKSDQIYF